MRVALLVLVIATSPSLFASSPADNKVAEVSSSLGKFYIYGSAAEDLYAKLEQDNESANQLENGENPDPTRFVTFFTSTDSLLQITCTKDKKAPSKSNCAIVSSLTGKPLPPSPYDLLGNRAKETEPKLKK